VDVTYTYVSNRAYREAVAQGLAIVQKGPRSGWAYEIRPTGRRHRWTCVLCHPPADGLEVEYREVTLEGEHRRPGSRLRWRLGYGWRRDHEPDGILLVPDELSDEDFLRKVKGRRGPPGLEAGNGA
jgi:hypothetical protein